MTSIYLDFLYKDPIPKYSHSLRYGGLWFNVQIFEEVTIQPIIGTKGAEFGMALGSVTPDKLLTQFLFSILASLDSACLEISAPKGERTTLADKIIDLESKNPTW